MSIKDKKRFGLVLRTFATKAEDVPKRIQAVEQMVARAMDLKIFARIDVLVWADARYNDSDCGSTFTALAKNSALIQSNVRIHNFEKGDPFCGILNYGVALQMRDRIDYTMIASTEVMQCLNDTNMKAMLGALEDGARATGIAINELTESVLVGRLANTMCMWDNVSLMSVGGFDLRAAKPANDKVARYMRGSSEGKEVFYHLAGVEEIIPLARMVDIYGPCIAPILPSGDAHYQAPDPVSQPELYKRHVSKMGTKHERMAALISSVGYDLSYLAGGVMPKYRNQ